jgi:hypothetical protein
VDALYTSGQVSASFFFIYLVLQRPYFEALNQLVVGTHKGLVRGVPPNNNISRVEVQAIIGIENNVIISGTLAWYNSLVYWETNGQQVVLSLWVAKANQMGKQKNQSMKNQCRGFCQLLERHAN